MAARRGPTVRRMQLGGELRRLREKANMTLMEAVEGLDFSHTKLSRVETGHNSLPKVRDLENLLDRYEVNDIDDREFLLGLHRESLDTGWWTPYRNFMPSGMATYVGLETEARSARAWHPQLVYGLFQTENYARALLETAKPVDERTTEFVERNVRLRMERKELLTRKESPLELTLVLDESALRPVVGGPEVMREQYAHIAELCRLDNVTVQVLLQSTPTYRSAGNFVVLDFDGDMPSVVKTDGVGSVNITDKQNEVWKHARRFSALQAGAMPPSETPAFLERLAREV